MEAECVVKALVFLDILLSRWASELALSRYTWRPVLLACLMVSSKVNDDCSMVRLANARLSSARDASLVVLVAVVLVCGGVAVW